MQRETAARQELQVLSLKVPYVLQEELQVLSGQVSHSERPATELEQVKVALSQACFHSWRALKGICAR